MGQRKFKAEQGERFKSGKTVWSLYSSVTTTWSLGTIYSAGWDKSDPVHNGPQDPTCEVFPLAASSPVAQAEETFSSW